MATAVIALLALAPAANAQSCRVVRQWHGPMPLRGGAADVLHTIAISPEWQAEHLGVAAFVEDPSAGAILQASSLDGCRTSGG